MIIFKSIKCQFVIKLMNYQSVRIRHYKDYIANSLVCDVVLLNANQNAKNDKQSCAVFLPNFIHF